MTYRCLAEHKVYQRGSSTNGGRLLVTSEASIRERSYTIFVPVFSTNLSLQIRQLHPTALGVTGHSRFGNGNVNVRPNGADHQWVEVPPR